MSDLDPSLPEFFGFLKYFIEGGFTTISPPIGDIIPRYDLMFFAIAKKPKTAKITFTGEDEKEYELESMEGANIGIRDHKIFYNRQVSRLRQTG